MRVVVIMCGVGNMKDGKNWTSEENCHPTRHTLTHRLLVHRVLGLLLLGPEELTDPAQGVRRDDQARRDHGTAGLDQTVSIAVTILVVPGLEDVVLALNGDADREEDGIDDGAWELVRRRLDDGKGLFDSAQAIVGERVSLFDVGRDVLIRTVEVREERLGEGSIALVG